MIKVDLPAPFSPSKACTSPACSSKLTDFSTEVPKNDFRISCSRSREAKLGGTNYSGPKKRINRKARDAPMLLRSRYRARARFPASRAKAIRRHLRSRLFCHSNRYPPTNGQSSITTTSTSTIRYNATIGDRSDVRQQLSLLQREQSEDLQFADRSRCGQFGCGRLLATRSGSRGDTRNRRRLGEQIK